MNYRYFDTAEAGFPAPAVQLLPSLTASSMGRSGGRFQSIVNGRRHIVYKRGRYALLEAFRLCGVQAGTTLLAPAYHCRTMLDPAIRLGATPLLYPLDEQLAPKLPALRALIDSAREPAKALLLTHYFGVPQDSEPVRRLCDQAGVALIEDCSHALFNPVGPRGRLGRHGRYVVASPYKLLPCQEGGVLIAGTGDDPLPTQPRAATWRDEVSVCVRALESVMNRRRMKAALDGESNDHAETTHAAPAPTQDGRIHAGCSEDVSPLYAKDEEGRAGAMAARVLAAVCDIDESAQRRRRNYARWARATHALPNCRPLFPLLADDCVPYMFPLHIDRPEDAFARLKRLGLPIWRWDEMAISDCVVSTRYSHQLLHLPCHQALSEFELTWMLNTLSSVMNSGTY